MGFKTRYENLKPRFLSDPEICKSNRDLFTKYLVWQEKKLISKNGFRELDDSCCKTLYTYVMMFRNVNKWFGNKPLKNITRKDLERVWNDLESGKIKKADGNPYEDRASYYSKIFKGKLFKMIKKYDIATEVFEFWKPAKNDDKVKFFEEKDFGNMLLYAIKPEHKLMLSLLWDVGENVFSILQLQRKEIRERVNSQGEMEYLVTLKNSKIKRSRTARTEPTNYANTAKILKAYIDNGKREFVENPNGREVYWSSKTIDGKKKRKRIYGAWIVRPFKDEDYLFDFGPKQAEKVLRRVVEKSGVICLPDGERPTLKDFRSSMACHLLKEGWSCDEVRSRLGHKPSSKAIDKYVNYLAIGKGGAKKKLYDSSLQKVEGKLEESKQREKLLDMRVEKQAEQLEEVNKKLFLLSKKLLVK
jgi:integrase